jgi:hypothetical protein
MCPYFTKPLFHTAYCSKEGRILSKFYKYFVGSVYNIPDWCPLPDVNLNIPVKKK